MIGHKYVLVMHLSMQSPTPPPSRDRGGFVNLEVQRTHPRGNIIWQTPGKNPGAWQFYLYYLWLIYLQYFSIQTNSYMIYWLYKVPTPRARFYWQSPCKAPPCPGRGVVGLCIDRCINAPLRVLVLYGYYQEFIMNSWYYWPSGSSRSSCSSRRSRVLHDASRNNIHRARAKNGALTGL